MHNSIHNILIIDDDINFRDSLVEDLERDRSWNVLDRFSSEEEVNKWIESGKFRSIDGILLDPGLPFSPRDMRTDHKAGLRILQKLREKAKFFGPVIILTSSRDLSFGKKAMELGCDGYISKETQTDQRKNMLEEIKLALSGRVIVISSEMRYVFLRHSISAKEALLLDMLLANRGWSEIARSLGYNSSKAAANVGDRIFDKLLSEEDREKIRQNGIKKRDIVLRIWKDKQN